ncbi:hypothetical protein DWY99_04230 [[Clostridium] leptum]|uniref:Uncharacterized protein n=1 Tax=[Clostridium] leptum TaxID=1535 RepID=A0A412AYP0_9FIRM|nr:hypothetical protein DWY99_04230 [[Clostridium] leptum]
MFYFSRGFGKIYKIVFENRAGTGWPGKRMENDRQKMKNSGSGFLCLIILKLSFLERPAYHKSIKENI